jgi:hypothetical protein
MKAHAYAVHRLPGRVRLKVPSRRNDRPFFDELARRLKRLDAVTDVRTNPTTGSILVEHKGEIADLAKDILGGEAGDLIELALSLPPVARRVRAEIAEIDGAVQHFTGGQIDLGTLASLGLLALAALQMFRGRQATNVVSLGWYASELLRRSGT